MYSDVAMVSHISLCQQNMYINVYTAQWAFHHVIKIIQFTASSHFDAQVTTSVHKLLLRDDDESINVKN